MVSDQRYLTHDGLQQIKEELRLLKTVRRPEIAEKIERAKELGDLSENAEYHEAKEEQGFIEGRIIELEAMVNSAVVVSAPTDARHVEIGNTVRVRLDGTERTFAIVGANEARPGNGKISHESPLGRALLGRAAGDEVDIQAPNGMRKCLILEIS